MKQVIASQKRHAALTVSTPARPSSHWSAMLISLTYHEAPLPAHTLATRHMDVACKLGLLCIKGSCMSFCLAAREVVAICAILFQISANARHHLRIRLPSKVMTPVFWQGNAVDSRFAAKGSKHWKLAACPVKYSRLACRLLLCR